MGDFGLFGAARANPAPLHAVPARAWEEAAACRKDGGAVLTRMRAGSTSLLLLPAWLLRKLDAAALGQLLDDGDDATGAAPPRAAPPAAAPPVAVPSPRQLARRARRKRQRERRRAATDGVDANSMYAVGDDAGAACGALPSDDREDGEVRDAPHVPAPSVAAPAAAAAADSRAARKRVAPTAASQQPPAVLSLCGPGAHGAAAPSAAAKRSRGAGGSSAEAPRGARGPRVTREFLSRLSALAVTLREELQHAGVSDEQLLSRCFVLGEDHFPDFPVIKSGVWAQLSPDSLAEAVLSVMRDGDKPPLDGLWNAVVKGSYYFDAKRAR